MLNLKLIQMGKRNFPDEVLKMEGTPLIIGREKSDFIIKNDTYLSSSHFAAWFDEKSKTLVIRDLGSTNGTKVRGVKIAPHSNISLVEGEIFESGTCLFMVVPSAK